jgi:hypothetical protein
VPGRGTKVRAALAAGAVSVACVATWQR